MAAKFPTGSLLLLGHGLPTSASWLGRRRRRREGRGEEEEEGRQVANESLPSSGAKSLPETVAGMSRDE